MKTFEKDRQYFKFCAYGFLKNLRFYDAFLLLFFLDNGISYSQIGILYAIREIIINIFEIPSGIVADTYGRKNALLTAFLSYIISFLVFYISANFNLLLIAILLLGIGDAFRSGTHKGMIMDYLKLKKWDSSKIAYYGNTRSWSQKGSAISALVAGLLVLYSGSYRIIYLIALVPYLLNLINIITYPNELNYSQSKKSKNSNKSLITVFKNFIRAIKNRKVFYIIHSSALHSSYLKSIKDYIQPILVQIAILIPIMNTIDIKRKSGLIIGIIYFIIFNLTAQASRYSYKLSIIRTKDISLMTLQSGLLAGVVCGILINSKLWILSLIVFIFIYIIENLRKPTMTGILADNVPGEILTSVISAQSFYSTVTTSIIAILFGVFADSYGIGISLMTTSGTLIAITIIINSFGYKKKYK